MTLLCLALVAPRGAGAQPAPTSEEAAVAKHLGLFLTRADRRDVGERVVRSQARLEIWFQRTVPQAQRARVLCDGFRWLLRGRLAASDGVGGLFAALPDIDEVVLVFYEVETRVEPQADGRYRQVRAAGPRARFVVTRAKAAALDPAGLAEALTGPACVANGEGMVESFWAR